MINSRNLIYTNILDLTETYEAQNTLNRQFEQAAANQVWVTDTTEIAYNIRKCKVRLHVVLDLYGQYPLSWIITPTETSTGAIKVFQMAKQKAGGGSVKYFV